MGFYPRHDLLMEEDASQVDQLVFCDQKSVAHAAGEFLNMRLFYQGSEEENEELIKSPTRGRKGMIAQLANRISPGFTVHFDQSGQILPFIFINLIRFDCSFSSINLSRFA